MPIVVAPAAAGGTPPNSVEPLSQAAPTGRGAPRWSVAVQATPLSIAGLPGFGRRVAVEPPLFARAPSVVLNVGRLLLSPSPTLLNWQDPLLSLNGRASSSILP